MKLLLPYFILILFLLQHHMRKNSKKTQAKNENFWKRESEANSVRKKDISALDYITIPDTLSIPDIEDERIIKEWNNIEALKNKKIVNLTGFTNTDLKLEYGVGNLSLLTSYDNNYTSLIRSLSKLGELLMEHGFEKEAVSFWEFGVSTHCDIGKTYTSLASYYKEHNMPEKIDFLITQANQISSLSKDPIITHIEAVRNGSDMESSHIQQ